MASVNELHIVTYNMHGFNQGIELITDLVCSNCSPDIILLQEHWLTPANLSVFGDKITTHYAFGCSAMSDQITRGPLYGRPYGGTMILIKNELRTITKCVVCADRFVIIKVGNLVIVNVYLPCSGTTNRLGILEDVLQEIWSWRLKYSDNPVIIGGDFNSELGKCNEASDYIKNFLDTHSLVRCDLAFPASQRYTYVNEALGHSSHIDYFVCDTVNDITDYYVLDPDINLSDHLPVAVRCECLCSNITPASDVPLKSKVKQLRWDHADLLSYYSTTMNVLYPLYGELLEFETCCYSQGRSDCCQDFIDGFYNKLVDALKLSADLHVPAHYKNYYKFWWSEELSCLKENAIQSNEIWKAAGRPRTGPIADKRNADSDGKKVVKLNYFFN